LENRGRCPALRKKGYTYHLGEDQAVRKSISRNHRGRKLTKKDKLMG